MLRRSQRKSKVTLEKSSREPSIKRKYVHGSDDDDDSDSSSLHDADSSGDEFIPMKSTEINKMSSKEPCLLNLSESDTDNDDQDSIKIKKKLSKESDSESEEDNNICQTNFDFTAILNPSEPRKLSESGVKSENTDRVHECSLYDNLDVAKVLSVGEGVHLGTIINDPVSSVKEELNRDDNYTIPDVVEINVKLPNDMKCKKGQDIQSLLRRRMNTICKETQVLIHKVHILSWISYGNRLNGILNSPEVMGSALSLIPSEKAYPPKQCDLSYLENYIKWFSKKIKVSSKTDTLSKITATSLVEQFSSCEAKTRYELIAMFISMLRSLGLSVRLVINLNVVSIKPSSEQLLGPVAEENDKKSSTSKSKLEIKQKTPLKSEYFTKNANVPGNSKQKSVLKTSKLDDKNKKTKSKKRKVENITSSDEEYDPFVKSKKKVKSENVNTKSKKSLSKEKTSEIKKMKPSNDGPKCKNEKSTTNDEDYVSKNDDKTSTKKILKNDFWAEVFLEMEEKWISVDVIGQRLHCIKEIYNGSSHPMRYVLAWYNDCSIKDITIRYDPYFHTFTRKIRVDPKWWKATLLPYKPKRSAREREEDEELDKQLEETPLPKTVSEYKNHPLYALSRHLLKFQAIYPPDPPVVGHVRNEPVYLREYVHELNGRDNWLKEARVVKMGEKSYKLVKSRPRFDRNGVRTDPPPLELFGFWQTEPYDPPTATNGQVPRNCYGNVDLFKPCMLPKGTVHLQLSGLLRIAKKLNIDCAPAVVGFDFHSGGSHPVSDGFVVCKEYKDILKDAWDQEVEESRKREQKRYEDRVYGNWKRLVKGILIRERLKIKYNYFSGNNEGPSSSKKT